LRYLIGGRAEVGAGRCIAIANRASWIDGRIAVLLAASDDSSPSWWRFIGAPAVGRKPAR
jgi:hypothetical protein